MDAHKQFSAGFFNECWDYIDKTERNEEERETMLTLAMASLMHWKKRDDMGPMQYSIGLWQVSRAASLANEPELALTFANRCIKISEEGQLDGFYTGYAYEARARALKEKNPTQAKEALMAAQKLADSLTDDGLKGMIQPDLNSLKEELG